MPVNNIVFSKQHLDLDISPLASKASPDLSLIISGIINAKETSLSLELFIKNKHLFDDYLYWFLLGTLWVNDVDGTTTKQWRELFSSNVPSRHFSLMKPSECLYYDSLPDSFLVFRAKTLNEEDFLALTLSPQIAGEMALRKGVDTVHCYTINKSDVLAVFLRRGEFEILTLSHEKMKFEGVMPVVVDNAI